MIVSVTPPAWLRRTTVLCLFSRLRYAEILLNSACTMATLIITEKASQAKDLQAAFGARFGQILPAEGHLLRLAEPKEVDVARKSWSGVVLKPDGCTPLSGCRGKQADEA